MFPSNRNRAATQKLILKRVVFCSDVCTPLNRTTAEQQEQCSTSTLSATESSRVYVARRRDHAQPALRIRPHSDSLSPQPARPAARPAQSAHTPHNPTPSPSGKFRHKSPARLPQMINATIVCTIRQTGRHDSHVRDRRRRAPPPGHSQRPNPIEHWCLEVM